MAYGGRGGNTFAEGRYGINYVNYVGYRGIYPMNTIAIRGGATRISCSGYINYKGYTTNYPANTVRVIALKGSWSSRKCLGTKF